MPNPKSPLVSYFSLFLESLTRKVKFPLLYEPIHSNSPVIQLLLRIDFVPVSNIPDTSKSAIQHDDILWIMNPKHSLTTSSSKNKEDNAIRSRFFVSYFLCFCFIHFYRLFYCYAGTGSGQIWCHQYLKPFRCVCLHFIVFVPFSLDIILYLCICIFVFVHLYFCICIFVFVVLWWLADGRVSAISKTLRLHRRLHVLFKQEWECFGIM